VVTTAGLITAIRTRKQHSKILEIIEITHKKHPMWGVDPIWAEVKETIPCSRETVYRLMKKNGISQSVKLI
jgi:putative transposase